TFARCSETREGGFARNCAAGFVVFSQERESQGIHAHRGMGRDVSSAVAGAARSASFRGAELSIMPAALSVFLALVPTGRPESQSHLRPSHACDDSPHDGGAAERAFSAFRRSGADLRK